MGNCLICYTFDYGLGAQRRTQMLTSVHKAPCNNTAFIIRYVVNDHTNKLTVPLPKSIKYAKQ